MPAIHISTRFYRLLPKKACIGYRVLLTILNLVINLVVTKYSTASTGNDGAGAVDCDFRRAVGPTKTIRGVFWT